MPVKNIHKLLEAAMKKETHMALAARCGIAKQTLYDLTRKDSRPNDPRLQTALRIYDALGYRVTVEKKKGR